MYDLRIVFKKGTQHCGSHFKENLKRSLYNVINQSSGEKKEKSSHDKQGVVVCCKASGCILS